MKIIMLLISLLNISTAFAQNISNYSTHSNASISLDNENILGLFNTSQEYQIALELLWSLAKDEMADGINFAKHEILPRVQNFDHFLDIGPGTGNITKVIGQNFQEITLLDVSQEALNQINHENFSSCRKLNKIQNSILDTDLTPTEFDLINISHVFYYLPRNQWLEITKKAFNGLKKDGLLVIALSDKGKKEEFITSFGGNPFLFNDFIQSVEATFGKEHTQSFTRTGGVFTQNLDELLKICSFFLLDAQKTASENSVRKYISQSVEKKQNNTYIMDSIQNFLVITK